MQKQILLGIVLLIGAVIISCENSTEENHLFEYSDRFISSIEIDSTITKIVIQNNLGFISVSGYSTENEIAYFLDKTVNIENSDLKEEAFQEIYLDYNRVDDTLFVSVINENDNNNYSSSIGLEIPYSKNVAIVSPTNGCYISYLISDVQITEASSDINIFNNTGSINIQSSSGNVQATISLPDYADCKINCASGNILLNIPKTTNASLYMQTSNGNVSYNNLSISNLNTLQNQIIGIVNEDKAAIALTTQEGDVTLIGFD